jgi:hypothetical protein
MNAVLHRRDYAERDGCGRNYSEQKNQFSHKDLLLSAAEFPAA